LSASNRLMVPYIRILRQLLVWAGAEGDGRTLLG
jgi:hypothetical protein